MGRLSWSEYGYAAVDILTCGERIDPATACNCIREKLKAQKVTTSEIKRGILEEHCLEKIS